MIVIIDLDLGNLSSIQNMLKKIGFESMISNKLEDINKASKLILPGIGAFDTGMKNLKKYNLINILENQVIMNKKPILGICLGMQMMLERSEEGSEPGLGWIKGEVVKFKKDKTFRVPHMGWNTVKIKEKLTLTKKMKSGFKFYFVHSYFPKLKQNNYEVMKTFYGCEFTSCFQKKNIFGVQFHPEKSHKYGIKLLSNFAQFNV